MFCVKCGSKLIENANFCSNCGYGVNGKNNPYLDNTVNNNTSNIVGTLVTVSLINGALRQLYFYNNCYYYDRCLTRMYPMHMIRGGYRPARNSFGMGMGAAMFGMMAFMGMGHHHHHH